MLAKALVEQLRGSGVRPFVASVNIEGGARWRAEIYDKLYSCRAGVILLTHKAITSCWVQFEASILLWRRAREGAEFPLLCLHVTHPAEGLITKEELKPFEPGDLPAYQKQPPIRIDLPPHGRTERRQLGRVQRVCTNTG
jgi:hypothetical protein